MVHDRAVEYIRENVKTKHIPAKQLGNLGEKLIAALPPKPKTA